MPLKFGPFYLGPPSAQDRAAVEASASRLPFSFPHVGVTRTSPPLPEAVAAEGWTIDHNRVQLGSGRQAYRKAQALLQRWAHFDLSWASVNAPSVKPGAPVVVTAQTLLCWSCNPLRISFVEEAGLRRKELPPWAGAPAAAAASPTSRQQHCESSGGGSSNSSSGTQGGDFAASTSPGGGFLGLARGSGALVQQQPAAKGAAGRMPRGRRYAFAHTTLEGHQIGGEERFSVAWNQEDGSVWYEIYTLSRPGSWITQATRPLLRAFQRKFAADSMAAMQREMLAP